MSLYMSPKYKEQVLDRKRWFEWDYKWFWGSFAWVLHRLSGWALVFYLLLHIWVIHHLSRGPAAFDQVMQAVGTPLFKVLEIGLWGVIVYHAFNGMRVIIVDFWHGSKYQKQLFFIVLFLFVVLWVGGGIIMALHMIH